MTPNADRSVSNPHLFQKFHKFSKDSLCLPIEMSSNKFKTYLCESLPTKKSLNLSHPIIIVLVCLASPLTSELKTWDLSQPRMNLLCVWLKCVAFYNTANFINSLTKLFNPIRHGGGWFLHPPTNILLSWIQFVLLN